MGRRPAGLGAVRMPAIRIGPGLGSFWGVVEVVLFGVEEVVRSSQGAAQLPLLLEVEAHPSYFQLCSSSSCHSGS